MKIGDEVYIHGYVDEIRQNVVIIRNDGGYFGTVAEEITSRSEIPNKSEIPTSCGDAISREKLIEALDTWDKFGYAPTHELIPLRSKVDKDKYVPYIHYDDAIKCIKGMPSVSPQQRTGRWIPVSERLPEKTGIYLISIGDLVTSKSFDGHNFRTETAVRFIPDAWMPLPKPYKAESEDRK